MPNWSPPPMFLFPDAWEFNAVVHKLFQVFEQDIIYSGFTFQNLKVVFDNRYLDDSLYPEGYWHIITRGKDDRTLDVRRAERLPWLKPIVENCGCDEILFWVEKQLDRKGSMEEVSYLWYEKGDYLVVLKKKPGRFFLATAFYVTGSRNTEFYRARFHKSKKKGTGG